MFTISTLVAFVAIVIGLFIIPGPAVLLVATRTAQNGRKAGVMAGLGIATGDVIHTLFAAIGLSAILMTSASAFNIVKYAGAAYLIYLGIRAILQRPRDPQLPKGKSISTRSAYSQAILIEVLNPKTALFFLSFLPQFVNPSYGSTFFQFLILGLIFVLLSAMYTTLFAVCVRLIIRVFKKISWLGRWSGKIVGIIYIGLGLRVAAQHR
ncbi:threonine/homoserine/homoserine lactone efflux protein [Cytobacillus horneckiae]|uniref:LysE family translocator n=1 Tax=Cytobacillus horneckiae TaxID=549687 RepID=A0A2N0ZA11_9BACI|nr:LysE family translocator [Cytobacillus horneckiae]MBN6886440.1 LysE family translocator [Cytobacillus horneckiae]MCM3176683.1 LysE family translocator [Cytobacillus horneckiae]MEC1158482.1 LysE family translocator [Cytobacillus horneckiae]MED2939585.1 LysE family translocator [Cytobacillus horneckiae]PKG26339.1 LysE family translocator [Cytobacillus horneckiae]